MNLTEMTEEPSPTATPRRNRAAYFVVALLGIIVGFSAAFYVKNDETGLTSQELSVALGVRHWRFTIPDDAESKFLGFEIHDGDAVEQSIRASGWVPGETVLVTVRPLMDSKKLECSVISKAGHMRGLLDNSFSSLGGGLVYTPNERFVNDIPLMKGNRNGNLTSIPWNTNKPGDVALRLAFSD